MSEWIPTTEDELLAAEQAGSLVEGHRLEFKAQLPRSSDGANRELAKDLASLAIDGGLLVIGVSDVSARPPTLTPISLGGLAERIDQVTATRCDPPLFVECREIPSAEAAGLGYLLVVVPPSALAPHMVDGRYWGRDDRTKRPLGNTEVQFYIHRRERLERTAERELESYIDRDPIEVAQRQLAHLYGVAVPLGARRNSLLTALDDEQPMNDIRAMAFHRDVDQSFQPGLQQAGSTGQRPDGWAFASLPSLAQGREVTSDDEAMMLELEISEGGIVRLLNGRGTDKMREPPQYVFIDSLVVGMTAELVSLAAAIGTHMGYAGAWSLGVAVRGPIQGKHASSQVRDLRGLSTPYSGAEYTEFTSGTTSELTEDPGEIGLRLIGRFLRSLRLEKSPKLLEILGANP